MNQVTNFLKIVTAKLTGDKDKEVAAKNEKKANAAVKGQIASLESRLIDAETKVEEATDALNEAKYPTVLVSDVETYLENILEAQNDLDEVQAELDSVKESIKYFTDLKAEFTAMA